MIKVGFLQKAVVEAAHRDGWWTGVSVKKIDDDKHLVYFDPPPYLIHFKRRQLRQNKGNGSETTKQSNSVIIVEPWWKRKMLCWVPSIVFKEMEDGTVVKSCKYLSWKIRHITPPLSVENYELMEPVEVPE